MNTCVLQSKRVIGISLLLILLAAWGLWSGLWFDGDSAATSASGTVEFDWATHEERAPGSDNWPMTWSDDDKQYTSWGDGGGFGGTNSNGRVSFGIAVVEGSHSDYIGHNRFGGVSPDCPASISGKSYGLISIGGVLYAWISPGSNISGYKEQRLYKSTDKGCSWSDTGVIFDRSTYNITGGNILNFGKDNAGARDGYVYSYFVDIKNSSSLAVQSPGDVYLARVPANEMEAQGSYEWYTATDSASPTWGTFESRQPVFEDATGVSWSGASVIQVPGVERYVLTTEHTETFRGNIQMHEGPEPWGPWTQILRETNWPSEGGVAQQSFYWNFSPKWFRNGGMEFTLVFTGVGRNDSWNTVDGSFSVQGWTGFRSNDAGEPPTDQ